MEKFSFPTSSLKYAMSVVTLPGRVQGARRRPRPLPLSLVGWCASCNNDNMVRNLQHLKNIEVYSFSLVTEAKIYLTQIIYAISR